MGTLLQRKLINVCGNPITIESNDIKVASHWASPTTYADIVLDIFNKDTTFKSIVTGRQNLNILDLGANIGLFSLFISDVAKQVIAVEPTPDHYYILQKLTNRHPNIKTLNAAVSANDESVTFFLHPTNSTANSLQKYHPNGIPITVAGLTIPSILNEFGMPHVDLCKLDIEGSEEFVITDNSLDDIGNSVETWHMEVHPSRLGNYEVVLPYYTEMFRRHGYHVWQTSRDSLIASRSAAIANASSNNICP